MFPELRCLQSVFVETTAALGADSPLVRGYGIVHTACHADALPDARVTVEMWVPEGHPELGWTTISNRTLWCSDDESEDDWVRANECPAIVSVPRRDLRTVHEVGGEIGPYDPSPVRPA